MTVGEVTPLEQPADGPFTTRQLIHLDEALRVADQVTGLQFSIYLGPLEEPIRESAEKLHARTRHPERSVLMAVSPDQCKLEIVTGSEARKRISDQDAKLAGFSMVGTFAGGNLAGGLMIGIDQLASHAGKG
ncbi:DUF5130 family protein [Actinoplanes couchii]|uniref:DUF5130 domain-containing protein n=1 Tax=Actinoplanes couchii TaxID=403638 RepID=A0ABQ3XAU1_9ACTN|nr:DUF5130 family protein [Actinoplanes couchii]MDR6323117.1 hypothetical protein [Actinoplanes couchii]GID55631.1 hypothetical protein Aco03nite_040350 [Actinoplanes couchii]